MEDVWKGTETKEREGLDNMDWTEGHSDCRAGKDEKSKSVVERLRETVEAEVGTGLKGWERSSATRFSEPGVDYITGEFRDVG